jgi:geranylgeranyl diphosphate synthase type II
MNFEGRDDVTIPEYIEMIRLKTAVLIGAALKLGALTAGAPEEEQELLSEFGIHIGLLFQLRDDLLDTYGDTRIFGKKLYGDIISNKKTFLYLKALEHTSGRERKKLAALYSNHSIDADSKVMKVLKYYEDADVRNLSEEKIREHYFLARNAFDSLKLKKDNKTILEDYTEQLVARNY